MTTSQSRRSLAQQSINADAMQANADEAARLLKILANGQRLRVLCLLIGGELSVGQINERIDLSQSALSQHLAKLRDDGLVKTRRESQTIYYRLSSLPAQRLEDPVQDPFALSAGLIGKCQLQVAHADAAQLAVQAIHQPRNRDPECSGQRARQNANKLDQCPRQRVFESVAQGKAKASRAEIGCQTQKRRWSLAKTKPKFNQIGKAS